MLEVDCAALTPEPVLKASGHLDRFTDLMVRDVKTNECFRADRLLLDLIEAQQKPGAAAAAAAAPASAPPGQPPPPPPLSAAELQSLAARAGSLGADELAAALASLGARAPRTGNALSAPYAFNLMFATTVGPVGGAGSRAFLRPETAQGIFTNFRRLLECNGGRLPLAAAQIGRAFRNEISPKQGLLRVREFEMAEIEVPPNPPL